MRKIVLTMLFLGICVNVTAAKEVRFSKYTVIKGDTLWGLAERHYQNPKAWVKIWEANRSKIHNPDRINPGLILYIPELFNWIRHIKSGKPFQVIFDKTADKFDDSKYLGSYRSDPMGNLKGGETYTVVYKDGDFICSGYNEGAKRVGTWAYSNANPSDRRFSLWGRIYRFDIDGNVYDPDYGLVGHMRVVSEWNYLNGGISVVKNPGHSKGNIKWRVPTRYFDLDPEGNPGFAYYTQDHALLYKQWNGSDWEPLETVGYTTSLPSIAIDPVGNVHIAWRNHQGSDDILYQCKKRKGNWLNEAEDVSDSAGCTSANPCLAVDESGTAHICWQDDKEAYRAIMHKYRDNKGWLSLSGSARLTEGNHYPSYMAVDSLGRPHVIYLFGGRPWPVGYQYWDGKSWQYRISKNVSGDGASYPALAVDFDNRPYIVYASPPSFQSQDRNIYCTYYNGHSWEKGKVSNLSGNVDEPTLDIDSHNNPHIVWRDSTEGNWETYYSYYDGTKWHGPENVSNTPGDTYHPCIALDKHDRPHIAWYDNTDEAWNIYYIFK